MFKFQLLLCPEKLNVKVLAELYKQKSLESLGKSSKGRAKTSTSHSLPQTMLVKIFTENADLVLCCFAMHFELIKHASFPCTISIDPVLYR
jgi:hypothetical protein